MRTQAQKFLTMALISTPLFGVACVPPGESEVIQESESGALGSMNGLGSINGLSSTNGLGSLNGLSSLNGLTSVNGLSSTNGLMTTDGGRKTVAYIAKCALPAGDSLVKKDQNNVSYTYPGQLGLAPQWKNGACDTACQEIMSACIMAHVNTTGTNISLWLDSTVVLGLGRSPAHPIQESAFFGNIFVSPPKAHFCNGGDWDRGPAGGRIGASQSGSPYTNPFGTNALCKNYCSTVGSVGEAYGTCGGFTKVITVFRDFDMTKPYAIKNAQTNTCLDVFNWSTANGGLIAHYPCNGLDTQKFYFERSSVVSDSGTYRVRSKLSGKYLDINGGSMSPGAGLIQWQNTGATNQQWHMVQIIAGSYLMSNVKSGLLLNTAGVAQGGQVLQNGSGYYTNPQMWKVTLSP